MSISSDSAVAGDTGIRFVVTLHIATFRIYLSANIRIMTTDANRHVNFGMKCVIHDCNDRVKLGELY